MNNGKLDVIIIGGSYAGLSAAMALGRSLKNVLIIDSGKPCNRQTPHSHNFITHDGETPASIAQNAIAQVLNYATVEWQHYIVLDAEKHEDGFTVTTQSGNKYAAKKLLFATGVEDVMPSIPGFAECWGISVLHCPYCHGYEVHNKKIGLLGSGEITFEHAKFISHWSDKMTVFTNGSNLLTDEQEEFLTHHNIKVNNKKIISLKHYKGHLVTVLFEDGGTALLDALFARVSFKQHCTIPEQLGCELTEQGYIKIDPFQKTTVPGVYAAGDNTTMFRSVAAAVAAGNLAGAMMNKELIEESFLNAVAL